VLTLGILSGTSVDALDIALVEWNKARPKLLAYAEVEWPSSTQRQLLALPEKHRLSLTQFGELHSAVGQAFAHAILEFMRDQQLSCADVAVIGSHGQTIWHHPHGEQPFSLQIGHPAIIAKQTGIAVAADFRMDDIALKGQGAPLAPAFHEVLFAQADAQVGVLNLGGIANISLLSPHHPTLGFDIGPANTLLDAWYREHHTDQNYDHKGAWAASAEVDALLLQHLQQHPYFAQPLPKSTGREDFSLEWLKKQLKDFAHLSPAQIQSSLMQLTVESIARVVQQQLPKGSQLWLSGGGVLNDALIARLTARLHDYVIASSEQAGYPAIAIEAMLFAWLGKQRLLAESVNLTSITGSKKPAILGGLWLP